MSVAGLLLVLAAAACHAAWNFCVKRINGGPELIWLFSLLSAVIYLPLALWILIVERPQFNLLAIGFVFGSAVLHLGYFLLLQTGYRKGELSLVYPVARATGPLLATALAVIILYEVITPRMAAGALVIVFGVLMLTGGIRPGGQNTGASLLFGLGAGALIGSYTAWDAYAVSVLFVPPVLLDYISSVGRVLMLVPAARRNRSLIRRHWQRHRTAVLAIAVFNPLAYILVLYALTFTPVSFVAPVREVSVLLTVLAGSLFLGEGSLKQRLGWATVILAGMTLLVSA